MTKERKALELAANALTATVTRIGNYDWNADPDNITLAQGEAFAAIAQWRQGEVSTDDQTLALAAVIVAATEVANADAAFEAWIKTGDDMEAYHAHGNRLRSALEVLYAAVASARAYGAIK